MTETEKLLEMEKEIAVAVYDEFLKAKTAKTKQALYEKYKSLVSKSSGQ